MLYYRFTATFIIHCYIIDPQLLLQYIVIDCEEVKYASGYAEKVKYRMHISDLITYTVEDGSQSIQAASDYQKRHALAAYGINQ